MGVEDIVKSYLVSLGYEVDSSAYEKFLSTLKKAESVVTKHTGAMSSTFIKAGVAYTGMVGTIITTTALMLKSLANQDLEYQKTALSLHMAKDAAKQYSIALKVLGQPPGMIAWMPELHNQYMRLRQDAREMELPEEHGRRMSQIRELQFQFLRLKQESIYGLQWIGFSIVKNLQDPLQKTQFTMEKFNETVKANMREWAERAGAKIADLFRIFKNAGMVIYEVGKSMKEFWDSLTPTSRALTALTLLGGLFLITGPFGKLVVGFILLTALLSEFWDAMQGKNTAIPREVFQVFISALDTLYRGMMSIIILSKAFWASLTGPGVLLAQEIKAKNDYEFSKNTYDTLKGKLVTKLISEGKTPAEIKEAVEKNTFLQQIRGERDVRKRSYEHALSMTNASDTEGVSRALADVKDLWTPGSEKYSGPLGWANKMSGGKFFWSQEDVDAETKRQEDAKKAATMAMPKELPEGVEQYRSIIGAASAKFGIPPALIAAMMTQESGGKATAVSPKGAGGLMQIMPGTAGDLKLAPEDVFNPEKNIFAGVQYMSMMLKETKGNVPLALAAYNAGLGKVKKANMQIPDIRETQNYVSSIMANYERMSGGGTTINAGNNNFNFTFNGVEGGEKGAVDLSQKIMDKLTQNPLLKNVLFPSEAGTLMGGVATANASPMIGPGMKTVTVSQ